MKKLMLLTIGMLLTVVYSSAQTGYQLAETIDFFKSYKMQTGDWSIELTESDIQGSPYLNDEFIKGTIYTTSKIQFQDIPLRYNIYNHNLEFQTPENKVLAMAAPEVVEKAIFGEFTMTYIPYISSKKIRRSFFNVIEEGKVCLYSQPEVVYQEPTKAGAYKDPEPARFNRRPDSYFIRIGLEAAVRVGNKKELIALFPEFQEEIATFVKKNKIKANKEEDLQKLVQYYNSL